MSLQEFFSDKSYGGSWADDDIDMASISVPIEKNKGYGYSGSPSYGSGGSRNGRSSYLDSGPPYIVKLSNIPVTSNDAFINDLFHSRFTPLVKFKILFDPFAQPLELGIVKKIAFVEVPSSESQSKVAKWQDVVYKGTRRVNIEVADFDDFQQSMKFNQENHNELLQVEQKFFSARSRVGHIDQSALGRGRPGMGRSPGGMPLDSIQLPDPLHRFGPALRNRTFCNTEPPHNSIVPSEPNAPSLSTPSLGTPPSNAAPPKPKPNPFGNAKPIDVLARQQEIEKNLITLKHTTMRAPWAGGVTQNAPQPNGPWVHERTSHVLSNNQAPVIALAPQQPNGPKKSLADILGDSKARDHAKNSRMSNANSTPKPVIKKPTVLMKKPPVSTPEPVLETAPRDVLETFHEAFNEIVTEKKEDPESIEERLSQVSVAADDKPDVTADNAKKQFPIGPVKSRPPRCSLTHKQGNSRSEARPTSHSKDKPEFKKPFNGTKQTFEGRRSDDRRKSERTSHPIVPAKEEANYTAHPSSERKPRRSSNKTADRPSLSGRKNDRGSETRQSNGDNVTDDTRKPRRDARTIRPNRTYLIQESSEVPVLQHNAEKSEAVNGTTTADAGNRRKPSFGDAGHSETVSGSTNGDSSRDGDSIRRGEYRARGRGRESRNGSERGGRRGSGRVSGGSSSGRGGPEAGRIEDGRREDGRREDGRREDGRREDGRRANGRRENGRREHSSGLRRRRSTSTSQSHKPE